MRFAIALSTLLANACCSSLPSLPGKTHVLPDIAHRSDEVAESSVVWRDASRHRDVPVKIYIPGRATGRMPVVVFSHGIGEDRESYSWLGRALARHGYMALHVTHAGTDRAVLERGYLHLYRAVQQKENWVNRPLDVSFVLDRIADRDDTDISRTAVVGHSAGAFTAFAVAGMRTADGENLRDERVKAIVPMSMPRLEGVVPPDGYDPIAIPVLNMTGTCDTSIIYRTFPRHRRIPFESSNAPRQYLVTIAGANHDSFVVDDPRHDLIVSLTVAFLRAWLEDDEAARVWFNDPGTAEVLGTVLALERKDAPRRE